MTSILSASFILMANEPDSTHNIPFNKQIYISPTPGKFPIVASSGFNSITGPREEDFTDLEECGFNLCLSASTIDRYNQMLNLLKDTDIKILIHSSSFTSGHIRSDREKKLIDFIDTYKYNDMVAGWDFVDEPIWDNITDLSYYYHLSRNIVPRKLCFTNFVGGIVSKFTGPCKTMESYVDTIQKYFAPDLWCSDFYPLSLKDNKLKIDYQVFFDNLRIFASQSKKTGVPMWNYCQSMAFTTKNLNRPAATLPYLSFEIFSALAYGSQGIIYWTYYQRPSTDTETYHSALVNLDGRKTKAWDAAKKINFQIKSLTSVFLDATWVSSVHTGNIDLKRVTDSADGFGPIARLSNGNKGVLVSHITNRDTNFLIIVSHDLEKKQTINLTFKQGFSISRIDISSTGELKKKRLGSKHSTTLSPGGFLIIEW